jgi:hypothetical protein
VDVHKRHSRDIKTSALAGKCSSRVVFRFSRLRPLKAIPVWASDGACRSLPTFYPFHPFYMTIVGRKPARASTTNKPVQAFRMRGISASVFANEVVTDDGRELTRFDVSIQRRYRDGDEFKTTTSFRRDDLPILQLLARRAWEFIVDEEASPDRDEDEDE